MGVGVSCIYELCDLECSHSKVTSQDYGVKLMTLSHMIE